ncbi:MAG: HAD-IA family hydrolase [Planctomycetota bacterium]|nr:HAD-IA family hydrolase [Planctomycetota bacterium]MCX8040536.1 HAD-IA family hydrolase [Planctomycetota bacterium]MDW8373297.1 HAD-IA family hydrolase [Planctomycetota bacterium]
MIRAVTVDVHGTLIVPQPSVGAIYAEIAASFGIAATAEQLDDAFAAAFAATRAAWPVPYGADDEDARRFWHAVIERSFGRPLPEALRDTIYDAFAGPERWRVLPGARAALQLIAARGLPCAVVSNFDCRLHRLLAGLELGPFACVVVSAQVGAVKPDPAPLLAAAAALRVPPAAILHLGDSEREDGELCRRCGCRWLPVDPERGIDVRQLRAVLDATT